MTTKTAQRLVTWKDHPGYSVDVIEEYYTFKMYCSACHSLLTSLNTHAFSIEDRLLLKPQD